MKNNRKNIIIGIFVTTTILLGIAVAFFAIDSQNNKDEVANNSEKITKYETKINELNNEVAKYKAEALAAQKKNTEDTEKEDNTKTELSQENLDKIAQATIRRFLNFDQEMMDASNSVEAVLKSSYFNFYSSNEDLTKHYTKVDSENYKTDIKYENFIAIVTKYMTREFFDKKYASVYKNVDGYLSLRIAGAGGGDYDVTDVTFVSKSNDEYTYKVKYNVYPSADSDSGFASLEGTLKIKNVNGSYVVSEDERYKN